MRKRVLSAGVLAVFCVLAFCTVGIAASDAERVVNIAYQGIADSFLTDKQISVAESVSHAQIYDTLLTKDLEGNFHPSLAESWEVSDEGKTYAFVMRKDIKWQDGEKFTAADVKFTVEHMLKAPAFSWVYQDVESMELVDEMTIKMRLKNPNSVLLSLVSSTFYGLIMPKHAVEKFGDSYGTSPETTVGTGAYIVTDWKPDVSITYKAKEDYFGGAPAIKTVVLHQVNDSNSAIVALQTGELDIYLVPISGNEHKTLSTNKDIAIGEYLSGRNEAIYMYCKDGMFKDIRMRKAIALAVNKEDYITVGVDGLGKIINYPGDIGPGVTANPDFVPETKYEQDIEKAKALVEEAGQTGKPIVVKSYNTAPYPALATYIQSILTEIGLNATVEPMERATFLSQVDSEQVPILPFSWWDDTYDFDQMMGVSIYSKNVGTAGNYSYYIDPEVDKMVDAARAESDIAKRKEIYKEIVNKYLEDIPFVSMYATRGAIARRSDLSTKDTRSIRMVDYFWGNQK
ncbi:MAG: ABC transporter substrate-binding protein [Synergistaceae bacterium]|nr:ABC transporter substrate-binding protein [Synergistaceae bacterium]